MTLKPPVRIAVTGAAGQIAYATLFRIAGGIMLGRDQPIILQLLDLPQAQQALRGVIMEMQDCAFPLLADIFATDDPEVAFKDADIALLIGARPRTQGMERASYSRLRRRLKSFSSKKVGGDNARSPVMRHEMAFPIENASSCDTKWLFQSKMPRHAT